MQLILDLFISINCSTCFRRFLRPSSGARTVHTESGIVKPILLPAATVDEMELTLYAQFRAPDDGRRNRLKHLQQFIEINRSIKRCVLLAVL
jgi:hypothetical protein